jgi:predicted transcriptional regulator
MQMNNYILNDIKVLSLTNTIGEVKSMFSQQIITHIPIIDNGNLYGLIAERDMQGLDNDDVVLKSIQHLFQLFFTQANTSWLDIIKCFTANSANIMPVLDDNKKYIGYFELSDVLHFFGNTPFLKENGVTLVLSKHKNDFAMSELAQIIESNEAKLLGVFISNIDNDKVELTIKISSENTNDVIHTFRRYDYEIILGIEGDEYLDDLKDRSEYLQKYLSI